MVKGGHIVYFTSMNRNTFEAKGINVEISNYKPSVFTQVKGDVERYSQEKEGYSYAKAYNGNSETQYVNTQNDVIKNNNFKLTTTQYDLLEAIVGKDKKLTKDDLDKLKTGQVINGYKITVRRDNEKGIVRVITTTKDHRATESFLRFDVETDAESGAKGTTEKTNIEFKSMSNTQTRKPNEAPVEPPITRTITYEIKSGDTASALAVRYCTTVKAIAEKNNNKTSFDIGDLIIIPTGDADKVEQYHKDVKAYNEYLEKEYERRLEEEERQRQEALSKQQHQPKEKGLIERFLDWLF